MKESGPNTSLLQLSNVSEEGVGQAKNHACDSCWRPGLIHV